MSNGKATLFQFALVLAWNILAISDIVALQQRFQWWLALLTVVCLFLSYRHWCLCTRSYYRWMCDLEHEQEEAE